MHSSSQPLEKILELFVAMPRVQLALVALFIVFSVLAGNAVFLFHYRRVGKPLRSLFNPASFPLLNLNAREWLLLIGVFVVSLAIGALAVFSG